MSIWGNTQEGQGGRIGPGVETPGQDGFDAMGKPVSMHRRQAAYDTCKTMGRSDSEANWDVVSRMANCIQRDEPMRALEEATNAKWDVTAAYRLLAVLCTA